MAKTFMKVNAMDVAVGEFLKRVGADNPLNVITGYNVTRTAHGERFVVIELIPDEEFLRFGENTHQESVQEALTDLIDTEEDSQNG